MTTTTWWLPAGQDLGRGTGRGRGGEEPGGSARIGLAAAAAAVAVAAGDELARTRAKVWASSSVLGGGLVRDMRPLRHDLGCCLHDASEATVQAGKETVMRPGRRTSSRTLANDASAATAQAEKGTATTR